MNRENTSDNLLHAAKIITSHIKSTVPPCGIAKDFEGQMCLYFLSY